MPIMAAQGRNDARSAARLLAYSAKESLDNPERGPANAVALNNVFRLLEAYRVNAFFGLEPVTNSNQLEDISLIPPLELHISAVRDVFQDAIAMTFVGQSKNDAIVELETTLKGLAYPELGQPSSAARSKAAQFFTEVSNRL